MYSFFSMLSRMKYINRWGLMRNTRCENLCEHSLETAIIAHALVMISNKKFGGKLDPDHAAVLAMFHDCSEIITGDLPTPIKYHSDNISIAYKEIENSAIKSLTTYLPDFLKDEYTDLLSCANDEEYHPIVKAADKISAYIKCVEEKNSGNKEFIKAEISTFEKIQAIDLPEVKYFIENMLPSYSLSLDEQS